MGNVPVCPSYHVARIHNILLSIVLMRGGRRRRTDDDNPRARTLYRCFSCEHHPSKAPSIQSIGVLDNMMLLPKKSTVPLLWCASSLLAKSASSFTAVTPKTRSRFVTTMSAASHSFQGKTVVSIPDAMQAHSSKNVKFVDGSWFLAGRNARDEFEQGPRILGSHYFDIDDIATPSSSDNLMHMMPTKELFAAAMDSMGITNQDHIIVYGSKDCLFFHRAWFQIRNMGHDKDFIHMLHGSLADWQAQGGPIEEEGSSPTNSIVNAKDLDTMKPTTTTAAYQATNAQNIVDKEELLELIIAKQEGKDTNSIWVDARAPERFRGEVEEPRPGMRLGHMPFAKNVFFKDLLNPDNVLEFKPKEELEQIIRAGGVDLSTTKRIIVSCGSGATACALVAALELVGIPPEQCYIYDASWAEWGGLPDTPIVKEEKEDIAKRQNVEA